MLHIQFNQNKDFLAMINIQLVLFSVLLPFLLLIFILYRTILKSKTKSLAPNLPPGPWKLPVLGNIHNLVGSLPHRRLRDLANKHGPIVLLQLGQIKLCVISSSETAKEVMKTHDVNFAQRPNLIVADIVFYNCTDIAAAPYGAYWRQLRKICVLELLSAKRVHSFRSIREEEVSKLVKFIAQDSAGSGSVINLSKMLFSLMYDIISRIAFGTIRKEKEEFVKVVEGIIVEASGFNVADLFPSSKLLRQISGLRSKAKRLHQEADKIIENIIKDHRLSKNGGVGEPNDLVDVLLDLQNSSDLQVSLTTDNIKAVILDMFIAGSETSYATTEWAMSEMLKHPEIMMKAQAEVRQVVGAKGKVEETDIHELNFMKLVIKETLRLHPPLPLLLPRESREECNINGYQIPAKTRLVVNAWALGRDPNYWAEPESFKPERFVDGSFDYKGNDFEFIPFGAGRRICPGVLFGMASVELPLANLLYHFDWKLPNGMQEERLDMEEAFGATCRRKNALELIPVLG